MSFSLVQIFLRLGEISVVLVWLGFELFGVEQSILRSVQLAVVILLYVAISIGCFAKFFGDILKLYQGEGYPTLMKGFRFISRMLTLIGRIVFEIVVIWTGVNALQRKKEKEPYFSFALAGINLLLILLILFRRQKEEKILPKEAHAKID